MLLVSLINTYVQCFSCLPYSYRTHAIGDKSDLFGSRTGILFDRYAASEAVANLVVSAVFNPQRAERLATQRAMNDTLPSLMEVLRTFSRNVISLPYTSAEHLNNTTDRRSVKSSDLGQSSSVQIHELSDCNGLKPVASGYLIHANDSNHDMRSYKRDQRSAEDMREVQDEVLPHPRPHVSTSIESVQSNPAANEQLAVFRLECFVSQSVLVNAYLLLLTDAASSFLVKSQLSAHLKELATEIHSYLLLFQQEAKSNAEKSHSSPIYESDYLTVLEIISHLEMLSLSILSQKPFLSLLPTPMGPPI